ncbi:lysophospholipid acyltransferase family protein [Nonomuraea guangzhouensis]|uniref:Lysophospholipid acyltransferase family protein n=1 Tax=Nonomuraea guangzhouensis TaxID=1291555 RepID=A0ABW4GTL2_9ACTN|nr:lysophospholipid acyltransferase family protein [Nonomuraea guangzhouensis]
MKGIAKVEIDEARFTPKKGRGVIVVANHRSMIDLFIGLLAFRHWRIYPYMFVRADYFRLPVVGQLLRAIGGIPAGRGHGREALYRAVEVLRDGHVLALAPEGRIPGSEERSDGIAELRRGAAHLAVSTGAPLLLVGLINTDAAWPRGAALPRVRLSPGRRPTISVSAQWLSTPPDAKETEVLREIRTGLASILARTE